MLQANQPCTWKAITEAPRQRLEGVLRQMNRMLLCYGVHLGLDSRKEGERPSEPGSLNGLNHAGGADLDPQLAGSNS